MIRSKQFAPVLQSRLNAAGLRSAAFEPQSDFKTGSVEKILAGGDDAILNRTVRLNADTSGVDAAALYIEAANT